MKSSPFLTVNLVSGLIGSGKSSMARASGASTVSLETADQEAVASAIARSPSHAELTIEVHP